MSHLRHNRCFLLDVTKEPSPLRARNPLARFRDAASHLIGCLAMLLVAPLATAQTDRVYFPAVDDVAAVLVASINAETERIDMSAWYLTERAVSIALVNAFNRGVQVRLIGDRGAIFEIDPRTKYEFYWLASRGIPIRLRYRPTWFPEIDHWKATIFKGQQLAAFGSANYTPNQLRPASSTNYSDETVLVTADLALVGAFLTKFDVLWNDTAWEPESRNPGPPYFANWDAACAAESACADYRQLYPNPVPMRIDTARLEPERPAPPDLIWGQGPAFNGRLVQEILAEPNVLKLVAYRLTVDDITQALLARYQAGVPTQLIVEPDEYLNRKWPEFWLTHANIDLLWAAGVPIKQRRHAGLTHMKMLVTSRYATNASSNLAANWQRDHNYFVSASRKPAVYQAMAARFDTMWNDAAGFTTFVPRPPDQPLLASPAAGGTVSQSPTLRWNAAPFATAYDVYLGSHPASLSLVATVPAELVSNPPATYSWASGQLADGTTFYWKVVAKTNATVRDPSIVASSGIWSFVTTSTPIPPPAGAPGTWSFVTGGTGGSGGSDFDGDASRDLAVWRPTGTWFVLRSGDGFNNATYLAKSWGMTGDVPVPGDYDADGITDFAVWRPSTGAWFVLRSADGFNYATYLAKSWGMPGDVPVPGDYDADGMTDFAVWRPSTGTWFVLRSSEGYNYGTYLATSWGMTGDVPVPGDYDADGVTDFAVWRPSTGTWFVLKSSDGYRYDTYLARSWGMTGDLPVTGDYDGDSVTDLAVWRPSAGTWFVLSSREGYNYDTYLKKPWGMTGDVPVPGDYDADGITDLALWRPSTGTWFVLRSSEGYEYGTYLARSWGMTGDVPVR